MLSGGYTPALGDQLPPARSPNQTLSNANHYATHFLLGHLDLAVDLELLEDREQRVGAPWGGKWVGRSVHANGDVARQGGRCTGVAHCAPLLATAGTPMPAVVESPQR